MALVRSSVRALLLALIAPSILQVALLSMAWWGAEYRTGFIAPDRVFGLFVTQLAMIGGALYLGHLALRQLGTCSRGAYATAGGAAAVFAYVMTLRYGLHLTPPTAGAMVTAAILPTLSGALAGFLYSQFAGLEYGAGATAPSQNSETAGESDQGFKGRFEGPVRVRTSLGAILLAAALPAVLTGTIAFSIFNFGLAGVPNSTYLAFPAQIFISTLLMTVIPSGIITLLTHLVARAAGLHRGPAYAGTGAAMGFLVALLVFPFSPFTALVYLAIPSTAFGALMGALYRGFAGLEPMPLPEAVIVTDPETLVPHDDLARRSHSIVLNS